MTTQLTHLTKSVIQQKYPDVYDYCQVQCSLADSKFEEKLRVWELNGISCFERWTVPYFIEREKDKKRPCLRLNYPSDGKCNDCIKNACRYDKICFVCGQEGHGAFQTFPAQFPVEEVDIISLFKLGGPNKIPVSNNEVPPVPPASNNAAPPVLSAPAQSSSQPNSANQSNSGSNLDSMSNLPIKPSMYPNAPAPAPAGQGGWNTTNLTINQHPAAASNMNSSNTPPPFHSFEFEDDNDFSGIPILKFAMVPSCITKSSISGCMFYRGSFGPGRDKHKESDVSVKIWRKGTGIFDINMLKEEIKVLRYLAANGAQIARILHPGIIDIMYPPVNGTEFQCIASELSEYGYLDQYISNYLSHNPRGFPLSDIQIMSLHLIEALVKCHNAGISHRDLKPQSILVCKGDSYQPGLLSNGLLLKLCDFGSSNINSMQTSGDSFGLLGRMAGEKDCFASPDMNDTNDNRIHFLSDMWSLGCVLYYIATGGQTLFDSYRQAKDASLDDNLRKVCLEKHGLQELLPMIHDLIERMIRPIQTRATWQECRCHPFLWPIGLRKKFILEFADAPSTMPHAKDVIEQFMTRLDSYGIYVFDKSGWAIKMSPELLDFIQPSSLKDDNWWSARALLQAIRNQLLFPTAMHKSLYSNLTHLEMISMYLRTIFDKDFPKLLILIYELGRHFGKWTWDGRTIHHEWNTILK